ncbi:MAG TPA: hypothetical protein VF706_01785 [Solirubrobacteraceae bacterium]
MWGGAPKPSAAARPSAARSTLNSIAPGAAAAARLAATARRTAVALAAAVALVASLNAAAAVAAGGDRAATAFYVRADYALVATAHAKQGAAEAALQSLLARVHRECPSIVAGSPQNEASEKLTFELVGTMRLLALKPIAGAIASYARAVSGLRWSDAALTREVRAYARELLTQSRLAVPDFCGELRAWKQTGYASLPPGTLPFNKAYYAVYVGIGLLPTRRLGPTLEGGQRGLVQRTLKLEDDVIEFEANAVETWGQIMNAAGLQP